MDKDTRQSMKGAPCIRGLKFKVCPGKEWDGKDGCPLWFEALITIQEGQSAKEVIRAQCVDIWQYDFMWWNNSRLAGSQSAIESFRNGMVQQTSHGAIPKPDIGTLRLLSLIESRAKQPSIENKEKILEIETG